jgi:CNT family concentrative nucleoside transporter
MSHPLLGLIGVALILFTAWLASDNRRAIRLRTVGVCFALQVAIAVFVFQVPWGVSVLDFMAAKVTNLLSYADAGINFVFGNLAGLDGFSFLIRVLPVVIFFASLMEVLYHLKVMQIIVRAGGSAIRWLTDTRPVESLNVVANIFVGQTEAPLSLKPYLPGITKPELFTIMVSGLASVSGTVLGGYIALGIEPKYLLAACFMSAPAGLLMAKMIMPDTRTETKAEKQAEAKAVRLVDWAHAFETVGGDHQLLHELIKVFLKDRDSLVDNIRNALESDNDKELRLSAHSIKGALTHLGARESAELAMKMESLASKQDINSARSVFEKFASSLEPLTAELKEFVSGK